MIITETEKLYSPLFCGLNDNGGLEPVSQEQAADYEEQIHTAMLERRLDNESERGLMVYYYDGGSVDEKVESLFVDVEVHGGKLWGVAELELNAPLTPDELDRLKDYLNGQYSDGFGEGFAQRGIEVDYGELHVGLWSDESDFYIVTEQEFIQRFEHEKAEYNAMLTLTEKLYSPLDFYIWNSDSTTTWQEEVPHKQALQFKGDIDTFMSENRLRYDTYDNFRGLMNYTVADSFAVKVHSVYPAVEEHNGRLWLAASVRLTEPLTPDETANLKYWWVKEINDGWGGQVNQHEINTSLGEMILDPQTEGREFFINTEREFKNRLENETPAQTALWESDASENSETMSGLTGLIQQLRERAEQNWEDYRHAPHETTPDNLFHISMQVVSRRDASVFIKDYTDFTEEQLNCLLQFANPVELIGDYLDKASDISEMPGILANILEEQENFKKHYALIPEEKPPGFEEMKQQLIDRLAENYVVYKRDMMDMGKEGIFYAAAEILPVQEAYEYFTQEHGFIESEVEFLLKFQNPLEFLSDKWDVGLRDLPHTLDAVFDNQERTLQNGGYTLVSDEPAPAVPETPRAALVNDGKMSVIDRIRQAEKEAKERVHTPKDKSNHKKSREEL